MARPDLPLGYGGWQAVDATPQEESHGKYRTGPASIRAIKEGKVNLNYDTKFIFAEVNADKVYWQKSEETKEWEAVEVESDAVGHCISTKGVGGWNREDLTLNYKYPEGSVMERIAVRRALKIAKNPVVTERPRDVSFSVDVPEELLIGKNVNLSVNVNNKSDRKLTVASHVNAQVVRYTGVILKKLKRQQEKVEVSAKGSTSMKFTFNRSDYNTYLDEHPMVRLTVMARVQETKQIYVTQKIVSLEKPDLTLTLAGKSTKKVDAGEKVRVKVTFQLPDDVDQLTGCYLRFEGSALDGSLEYAVPNGRGSGTYSVEKDVTIKKVIKYRKTLQLLATLNSKELTGLQGILILEVGKMIA